MTLGNINVKLASRILVAATLVSMSAFTSKVFADATQNNALDLVEKKLTKTDGKYYDESGQEVKNVVTKYTATEITKYYDTETGKYISAEERVEGKTYKEISTIDLVPRYYVSSLAKTEYGTGDKQLTFGWTKSTKNDYQYTFSKDDTRNDLVYQYSETNKAQDPGTSAPVYENPKSDVTQDVIGHVYGYDQTGKAALVNVSNEQEISIKANFINNFVNAYYSYGGAAIDNEHSTITKIEGDFVYNRIGRDPAGPVNGNGAAIFNGCSTTKNSDKIEIPSVIGDIKGNFIGNSIISNSGEVKGGAIFNGSIITTGNDVPPPATIGNITGDFIGNHLETSSAAYGGAIYNNHSSEIGNIEGNFIGNGVVGTGSGSTARGGAIYNETYSGSNYTKIGDITGDFIGNYVIAGSSLTQSSQATSMSSASGAAIYNNMASIGNIKGNFIGNYAEGWAGSMSGGAIYAMGPWYAASYPEIKSITGDFIGNKIYNKGDKSSSMVSAYGGAIYLSQYKINSIEGNFSDNIAQSSKSAYGGAIYLSSLKEVPIVISGDFVNNSAQGTSTVYGGALYNSSNDQITEIKNSNFYNNYASSTSSSGTANGGAIYTSSDLKITADNGEKSVFKDNYTNVNGTINDNAIYVSAAGKTLTLTADNNSNIVFWDNINGNTSGYNVKLTSNDGSGIISLYNDVKNANIEASNVTVDFVDNIIRNYDILSLKSDDTVRYNIDVSLKGDGSADTFTIKNASNGIITLGLINVIDKYNGTPITIQIIKTTNSNIQLALSDNIIIKNDVDNILYNDSIVTEADALELATTKTDNDSITIKGEVYDALDVISTSDNNKERSFVFETNDKYTVSQDLSETAEGTLNIQGINKNNSVIDGNNHTMFQLNNDTTLNIDKVTIQNAASVVDGTNPNAEINISNSNIIDNKAGISTAGKLNVKGNTTIANNGNGITLTSEYAEVTLDAQKGDITIDDKITGTRGETLSTLTIKNGNVNLGKQISDVNVDIDKANVNLKSDTALNNLDINVKTESTLNFANNTISNIAFNSLTLKDNLNLNIDVDLAKVTMDKLSANTFLSNGYKINVKGMNLLSDAKEDYTVINFADEKMRGDVTTSVKEVMYSPIYKYNVDYDMMTGNFSFKRNSNKPGYADLNPAVMTSPAAAQVGGYLGMLDTYQNAFTNMDMRMLHPISERMTEKRANTYALTDTDATTFLANSTNSESAWVRPFTSYDSVGLKNGPKVNSFTYGTFIGGDSVLHQFENGAEGVVSAHVSYLGSHQSFAGNSIYQNGGNAGVTGTLYKGNFFTGISINAGASTAESSTMYGHEDFTMFMAGVATKTGYNFEFKEGRFIIQPSLLLSYTFVNTFDFTNAAGTRIDTDNLHAVQIQPNVKFAFNTRNHWQPYLTMGMNWNIMNDSHYVASMTQLPALSVKPYFQYGVGIQRTINEDVSVFGQVLVRHGGRNGVAGNFGLKWILGKNKNKKQKKDVV